MQSLSWPRVSFMACVSHMPVLHSILSVSIISSLCADVLRYYIFDEILLYVISTWIPRNSELTLRQRSKVVTAFDSNGYYLQISNPFGGAGSSPAVVAFLLLAICRQADRWNLSSFLFCLAQSFTYRVIYLFFSLS